MKPMVGLAVVVLVLGACSASEQEAIEAEVVVTPDVSDDVGGPCTADSQCDDGSPCTQDLCKADGTCVNSPQVGTMCDDSNACTSGDNCNPDGVCVGASSVECDDNNSCTEDFCVPDLGCDHTNLKGAMECDGSMCTNGDSCQGGECNPGTQVECQDVNSDDCGFFTCNSQTGMCDVPHDQPENYPCKDGNPCTDSDACDASGTCQPGPVHDCVSQHPCKKSWCNETAKEGTNPCVLEWKQDGVGCDDGDACTSNDACQMSEDGPDLSCLGDPVNCSDGNPCTTNSCDEEEGCQYADLADGTLCELGIEWCGETGACLDGKCSSEAVKICDDSIGCTEDICMEGGQCKHEPDDAACDDGLWCNGVETCSAESGCLPGLPPDHDDQIPCTVDSCDEESDQTVHLPDDSACSDDNVCNGYELCQPEFDGCVDGDLLACDDLVGCTVDTCNPLEGCASQPDSMLCDDQNPCTLDTCDPDNDCLHEAVGGEVEGVWCCIADDSECDDGNQCTQNVCDTDTYHCTTILLSGPACDDSLACTVEDVCQDGQCGGVDDDCDDQVDCTVDSCLEPAGCQHQPDNGLCNDAVECTFDVCDHEDGCIFAPNPTLCNDEVECTIDSCNAELGCLNTPEAALCDDNVQCTIDSCDAQAGCGNAEDNQACDDKNPCTTDVCDKLAGCLNTYTGGIFESIICCQDDAACLDANPCTLNECDLVTSQCQGPVKLDGQFCDDENECTVDTLCVAGFCLGTDDDCDDNVVCTVDSCNADSGCSNVPDDGVCASGKICTEDKCDPAQDGCVAEVVPDCCGNGIIEDQEDCDDGNDVDGDGCSAECKAKMDGIDCMDILAKDDAATDGIYVIDPDQSGPLQPFPVFCDMTTDAGGWTLVVVSSDDGQDTWTWDSKELWSSDTSTFGSLDALNEDFKSPAHHEVRFADVLFVHQPSGIWGAYHAVGNNTGSLGEFIGQVGGPNCVGPEDGFPLTAGTLTQAGGMCSTDLFFNAKDREGSGQCVDDAADNAYGPCWNVNNNNGCPLDDPGYRASLGPCSATATSLEYCGNETPPVGFGHPLGLNSGQTGAAENYMEIYVRITPPPDCPDYLPEPSAAPCGIDYVEYGNVGGFVVPTTPDHDAFNAVTPHWTAFVFHDDQNPQGSGCQISASCDITITGTNDVTEWHLTSAGSLSADLLETGGYFRFNGQYTARKAAVVTWGISNGANRVVLYTKADVGTSWHDIVDWVIHVDKDQARARLSTDNGTNYGGWTDISGLDGHYYFFARGTTPNYQDDAYFKLSAFEVAKCQCSPLTCSDLGYNCWTWNDGCGSTTGSCGGCGLGQDCCAGTCGPNGCNYCSDDDNCLQGWFCSDAHNPPSCACNPDLVPLVCPMN